MEDLFRGERSLYTIYCYIYILVPRRVVHMSSILNTDYLEITPCVKWSLTTEVKINGIL